MPKVVTVGEILVEIMTDEVGQQFNRPGIFRGPYASGAPAIFIDQVARMGMESGIIARIGEDDFGRLNEDRLAGDGVDVAGILKTPGYTTGTAFVTYFADGERSFIYHFTHSAAGQLSPADINEDYFADTEYLHLMGCSLTASRSMGEAIWKAVNICKEKGAKICFDPNIRPELLNIQEIKNIFDKILNETDIILSGESELKLLFDSSELEETIEALTERGTDIIILKNGSAETRVYAGGRVIEHPPYQVDEVDPTGAGDCFDGAFIASLAEGESLEDALQTACAAGALGVTRKGPMEGAAFKKDVIDLIEQSK